MGKKAPLIDFDIGTGTSTIKYTSSILKKGSPPKLIIKLTRNFNKQVALEYASVYLSDYLLNNRPVCFADYFKRCLFRGSIIIFQQKISMATPPNHMTLYNALQYPLFPGIYSYTATNPLNQGLSFQVPLFPNQLSYQCFLPTAANYSAFQPHYGSAGTGVRALGSAQRVPERITTPVHGPPAPKFQKRIQQAQTEIVNLVSDQEEAVQPEKPCQDKSTTSNSKPNQYNPVPKVPTPETPNHTDDSDKKPLPQQKSQEKKKSHLKTHKQPEIYKHKLLQKKHKFHKEALPHALKNTNIFSRRIIEKEEAKKPPFRISKRERELLQVGALRDFKSQVMTGPQFQVKLPKFFSRNSEGDNWLKSVREDLLSRRYEQDSDEE